MTRNQPYRHRLMDPQDLWELDPCPHTYGVRICPCGSFATEPCRPTACISLARHSATQSVTRGHDQFLSCGGTSSNHCSLITAHSSHTFSAKERDSETGLSYFGARYYSSDLSIWLSVDPMSDKYPSLSPYVYCADNPIKLVDPNGEENLYAFHYAQRHLLNKVGSVRDISTDSWYGYGPGQHRALTKQDPTNESCYGVVWHAYMNSGDKITSYLQTGFSDKNNSFIGRYSSKEWFKKGNSTPTNQDGLSRSFETDIMKGEIGDIVFMSGHAAMLAGLPEQIEEDGRTYVKLKVYTSTSDDGFVEQDIIFDADKNNRTSGWSCFEGYGQLHQTKGKGNPDLE